MSRDGDMKGEHARTFRGIRNSQIPHPRSLRSVRIAPDAQQPAVEPAVQRRAWRLTGGLGDAVVSADEGEGDDVAHGCVVDGGGHEEQALVAYVYLQDAQFKFKLN